MQAYVTVSELGMSYEAAEGNVAILDDFTLNIDEGEFVTLMGCKNCGKSTVLKIIAGLVPQSSGSIVIGNREITSPGPDRAIVLPTPCFIPWMSALDNVLLGLEQVHHHGEPGHRRDIAAQCLDLVGMSESMEVRTSHLSLESLQRVALARAIALKPRMLLLDDPFSACTTTSRRCLQAVLKNVSTQCGFTTLMTTCDIDEALQLSDRVVLMTRGPRSHVDKIFELPDKSRHGLQPSCQEPDYSSYRNRISDFIAEQRHAPVGEVDGTLELQRAATLLRRD